MRQSPRLVFEKAIEEAALRISDGELPDELKAYALFFLNVTYIDLEKTETFDFMLQRVAPQLPIDLNLALGHEGKKASERSALMRKQDRYLRRLMDGNEPLAKYVRALYEKPVNDLVKQTIKAKERKDSKELGNKRDERRKR